MRSLFLSLVAGAAVLALAPAQAEARPFRIAVGPVTYTDYYYTPGYVAPVYNAYYATPLYAPTYVSPLYAPTYVSPIVSPATYYPRYGYYVPPGISFSAGYRSYYGPVFGGYLYR